MRTGHTAARPHTRVMVHLRDGKKVVAKFKEHRDRVVFFFDHPPIATRRIRTLGSYKGERA